MKLKLFPYGALLTTLTLSSLIVLGQPVLAKELIPKGNVTITDSGVTHPVDPEHPANPVNPDVPEQQPKGSLRIDYVSELDFGSVKIDQTDRTYNARAQLFRDETKARGSYIQITDIREVSSGWTLQMEQTKQFIDDEGHELTGATLSYDNAWANASHVMPEILPDVTRETLSLVPGEAVNVAQAEIGKGSGVWTIEFGASETNINGKRNTLYPLVDISGKAIIDSDFKKQAVGNKAISLSVPINVDIHPIDYKTEIIWTIAKLP